jgi:IS1 family transposase
MWQKICHQEIKIIATDGNYSYEKMFPKSQKHIVTKSETCLVEAKNLSLRYMLARLNRRTKRYSKSLQMLHYSVILWANKKLTQCIFS